MRMNSRELTSSRCRSSKRVEESKYAMKRNVEFQRTKEVHYDFSSRSKSINDSGCLPTHVQKQFVLSVLFATSNHCFNARPQITIEKARSCLEQASNMYQRIPREQTKTLWFGDELILLRDNRYCDCAVAIAFDCSGWYGSSTVTSVKRRKRSKWSVLSMAMDIVSEKPSSARVVPVGENASTSVSCERVELNEVASSKSSVHHIEWACGKYCALCATRWILKLHRWIFAVW